MVHNFDKWYFCTSHVMKPVHDEKFHVISQYMVDIFRSRVLFISVFELFHLMVIAKHTDWGLRFAVMENVISSWDILPRSDQHRFQSENSQSDAQFDYCNLNPLRMEQVYFKSLSFHVGLFQWYNQQKILKLH